MLTIPSDRLPRSAENNNSQLFNDIRMLAVDDDHSSLRIVEHLLAVFGICVESARDGFDALQCFRQSRYDLVLTDLQMPKMNGYELANCIKQESASTIVLIMTGCSPSEVEEYMESDAVDGWLFKPFGIIHLRTALIRHLKGPDPSNRVDRNISAVKERSLPKEAQ